MPKRSAVTGILTLALATSFVACAGRAYQRARAEDTAAAYAQFVREHPGSRYAQEARERSALVRVRAKATPAAYEEFLARYPDSPLLPELRAVVEESFLQQARAASSLDAYRSFLDEFGDGSLAERARGNAAYLEAEGFGGWPDELARFAAEHPASDFSAEARRSAEALEARADSAFRRVGFEVRIAAGTPGAERLARVFTDRAREAYAAAGLELVPISGDAPEVRLRVAHQEPEVRTTLEGGQVTSGGIVATTRIDLNRVGQDAPIWSEEFRFQTVAAARREGTSILFGAGTQPYWESFFVPVVGWDTRAAVRTPHAFPKPVVAVDTTGSHAYVLFGDGGFQVFELGDPEAPLLVGEYRRPRDLTTWSDLRVWGDRVVLFGDDGVEVVQLGAKGPRRVGVWERGTIGSIVAVEPVRGGLVTAGKRGLLFLGDPGGSPERLLDRDVPGLARLGDRLVFTDGTSLYVSTLPLLRDKRVEGELRLGSGFGPGRVRVRDRTAVVLGRRGLVRVSLARVGAPQLLSRIETSEVGRIHDATLVRGRLFLLGGRGLQLADARGERIVDAAAVSAESRLDASGRHLVVVGEQTMQVVDTTPFVLAGVRSPAALEPSAD